MEENEFDVHKSVYREYISEVQPTRCNIFAIYLFLQIALHFFQAVSPPIIRSTKLYIQRQVLSNRYCCSPHPLFQQENLKSLKATISSEQAVVLTCNLHMRFCTCMGCTCVCYVSSTAHMCWQIQGLYFIWQLSFFASAATLPRVWAVGCVGYVNALKEMTRSDNG
jgi:hypothetical protein